MTIQECYAQMGADYNEVFRRLYNEAMIRKFVRLFPKDDSFHNLEAALKEQNVKEAFRAAHTLKGVCQNLGFSNLYAPAVTLTETLRAGQLEGTAEQFAEVEKQYRITRPPFRHWTERNEILRRTRFHSGRVRRGICIIAAFFVFRSR